MELKRRGYTVRVGKVGEYEVGFVASRNGSTEYYQVTYLLASDSVREREFRSLKAIPDNHRKTVLSLDPFPSGFDGVHAENLINWLLGSY